MDSTNYKYILRYINNDYISSVEFNGDVNIEQLKANLKQFLVSCSWSPKIVRDIFNKDEEYFFDEREEYKRVLQKVAEDEDNYFQKEAQEVLDEYN